MAAAIAIYESPELRRLADDVRRRIAIALHSLGDGISPADPNRDPLFNRPEDAEGFLQSRGVLSGDGRDYGVDADDETRRRQREELMYWNALKEQKERERLEAAEKQAIKGSPSPRGASFDDFLKQEEGAEKGTFVYSTGTDASRGSRTEDEVLVRRRAEGVRGLSASVYANPFADENNVLVDEDEHRSPVGMDASLLSPGQDEIMSDIYNATDRGEWDAPRQAVSPLSATLSPAPVPVQPLVDFADSSGHNADMSQTITYPAIPRPSTLERQLADNEYMTAGQEHDDDRAGAFASIQAWAAQSSAATAVPNTSFYTPPAPRSPAVVADRESAPSEPEVISDGQATPTEDSMSVINATDAGSESDTADFESASRRGQHHVYNDDDLTSQSRSRGRDGGDLVLSDDEDNGMLTPASWTEVASVVSEDVGPHGMHS